MTRGQRLLEDLERQRRAGDPRLTEGDRAILERITTGDLVEEFAAGLAAISLIADDLGIDIHVAN